MALRDVDVLLLLLVLRLLLLLSCIFITLLMPSQQGRLSCGRQPHVASGGGGGLRAVE
jgi:hypothetical protein